MRNHLVLLALLPILGFFNYAIFDKESLRSSGELILLELAPVDPRSIMQGDYMRLRYRVAQQAEDRLKELRAEDEAAAKAAEKASHLVLHIGTGGVAKFARFHQSDKALAEDERLVAFHIKPGSFSSSIVVQPDGFFFQEGHAQDYDKARYGRVRINRNGEHILIGLANEAGLEIRPDP